MNIRISKLYQHSDHSALEVAFNSDPQGDKMLAEIVRQTGLSFKRPPANLLAMREIHIAEVGNEEDLERAFVAAMDIAEQYGEVHDSQKNMKGPNELTPNELGEALQHRPRG